MIVSIGIDEPNAAMATRASTLLGIEINASKKRLNASSTQRAETAAKSPKQVPIPLASTAAPRASPTV